MATADSGTPTPVREPTLVAPPASTAAAPPTPRGANDVPRRHERTVEEWLLEEGYAFDFFQAVRLLERLEPNRRPVGRNATPRTEAVRFRALLSLNFPPSAIYEIQPATPALPVPAMTVTFMGLTGPSGVLPRHYTELLLRLAKETKGSERYALRDWLDLFNHRLISLFYRAWEKYRFYIPYERGEYAGSEPDVFTRSVFSFVGLGIAPLRNRLRVSVHEVEDEQPRERVLAQVDDLVLLRYSGFFSHQPRCALSLEMLLRDYFGLPVRVQQFRGQWLYLDTSNQSRLGDEASNAELGMNVVAGNRVWDVQSKFRIRLGPLRYRHFTAFLPDRAPVPERKLFFVLSHLIRLYVGPDLDFDVQLILRADDVPVCQLGQGEQFTPRLGWNTWAASGALDRDAEDAVFEGEALRWL
jgi:type VI secretion system protein ImpH